MAHIINLIKQIADDPQFTFKLLLPLIALLCVDRLWLNESYLSYQFLLVPIIFLSALLIGQFLLFIGKTVFSILKQTRIKINWDELPPEEQFLLFDGYLKNQRRIAVRHVLKHHAQCLVNKGLLAENSMSVQHGYFYYLISMAVWKSIRKRINSMSPDDRQKLEQRIQAQGEEYVSWGYLCS